MKSPGWILVLLVIYLLILVGGFMLYYISEHESIFCYMNAMMGVVTFYGIAAIEGGTWANDKNSMRTAITCSFMVVYFFVQAMFFFEPNIVHSENSFTMLSNFTYLMAVVLAFYFGTPTIEKVLGRDKEG